MRGRVRWRGCEWVRCTYKRTYGRIHTPGHIRMPSFIQARRRRPSLVYTFHKNGNNKKIVKKKLRVWWGGELEGEDASGCGACTYKRTYGRIHTPGHMRMPSFIQARRRRPSLLYTFHKNDNNNKNGKKINSCRMRGRVRGGEYEWVQCTCKYTCVRIHTYTQNANTHTYTQHTHQIQKHTKNANTHIWQLRSVIILAVDGLFTSRFLHINERTKYL